MIANARDSIKAELSTKLEYEKPGVIPVHAGVLYRFVNQMELGDIVVYTSKSDRLVNIGQIVGEYDYVENDDYVQNDENGYPNHRTIK